MSNEDRAADLAKRLGDRVIFFLWMRKLVPDRAGETARELRKEIEDVAHDVFVLGQTGGN